MNARATQPRARELSDAELIAEILAGNREEFAVLVRRHNQLMFRACRAVLHDDHDAEDATQVAWLNVYRALGTFRAEATFRTWITRIAVNEAASRLRNRRRFAAVPTQEMIMEPSDDPEHDIFTKELGRVLEREIDALPEGLRHVLVLRDVIELDTAETADCLHIEPENVRVRLHRARQALAQRLAGSASAQAVDDALPDVWRFDGERCARVLDCVMAQILAPDARDRR